MSPVTPITAAGGVLYRETENDNFPQVALIFRRDVWDLPKGKLEEGEPVKKCALREVGEELGLDYWPTIEGKLTETYHEYRENGTHFGKTTYWYAMSCRGREQESFDPQEEEGIEKVQWTGLNEARKLVGYENLKKVLDSFRKWHRDAAH